MGRLACIAVVFTLLAQGSLASDGVMEINQACATSSTGCFPGDTAGFPVTIAQSGSYRLTGNLTVPFGTTAIQIDAVSVTLDLGGFIVSGPNVCTGYPTTGCTSVGGTPGINSEQFLVVVRNGSVTGMGGDGIRLAGASSAVDSVRVLSCGSDGIRTGAAGRVTNSFSGGNRFDGIEIGDGGRAEGNETRANGSSGISVQLTRLDALVFSNQIFDNAGTSIHVVSPIAPDVLISRNTMSGNGVNLYNKGLSKGDNVCGGGFC